MTLEPQYVRDVDLHGFIEGLCNKGSAYGDCVRVYKADDVDVELAQTVTRLEKSLTELRGQYRRAVRILQEVETMIANSTAGADSENPALAQLRKFTRRET